MIIFAGFARFVGGRRAFRYRIGWNEAVVLGTDRFRSFQDLYSKDMIIYS